MNLEEHVDLGSWARFEPTLAALLDGPARPDGARPGTTLLLTAPAPVLSGGPPRPRARGAAQASARTYPGSGASRSSGGGNQGPSGPAPSGESAPAPGGGAAPASGDSAKDRKSVV